MAFGALKGFLEGGANSITNPAVLSGSVTVAVGDLVFVVVGQQTGLTATAAADNLTNTYVAQNVGTDPGSPTGIAYYSRVTVAGTLTTINVTATASANDWSGVAGVIEGPFVVTPIDTNPANSTADATSPFSGPATGTLAQAQEAVLAWASFNSATVWTATSPNLLARFRSQSANVSVALGYQAVAATTTVVPVFASAANPTSVLMGTASFKRDLLQTLTPDLFTDADTFFTQVVSPGAVDLVPALFVDGDTFFTQTISPNISPDLYVDADTFYTQTVTPGAVNLQPSLYTDADTFFTQTVAAGPVNLQPSLYVDADAFFTQTVASSNSLTPALFSDGDTFFAPAVTSTYALAASLYSDADTFFAPTVVAADPDLQPALYVDADTFFTHVVSAGGDQALVPDLFDDADTFFGAVIAIEVIRRGKTTLSRSNAAVTGRSNLSSATRSNQSTDVRNRSPAVRVRRN